MKPEHDPMLRWTRDVVNREVIDEDASDVVTLACGHVVGRILPPRGWQISMVCTECLEEDMARLARRAHLTMWVVYDHPRDFPDNWVARRWEDNRPTLQAMFADTLEAVRDYLRGLDLTCIRRDPLDEPQITEVWL